MIKIKFLSTESVSVANRNGDTISNSQIEKLLGVMIDYLLDFDEYLSRICDKASQKLTEAAVRRCSSK